MAHLERLGPSSHVLTLKDGTRILFSYGTPVAAEVTPAAVQRVAVMPEVQGVGDIVGGYYRWKSAKFHSRTTSGHVARFLAGNQARAVDQAVLDSLVAGV